MQLRPPKNVDFVIPALVRFPHRKREEGEEEDGKRGGEGGGGGGRGATATATGVESGNARRGDGTSTVTATVTSTMTSASADEYYFLEPYLCDGGDFLKYSNNSNYMRSGYTIPAAFTHFTYHISAGEYMVVDLQGVKYMLTDPQIHQREKSEGEKRSGSDSSSSSSSSSNRSSDSNRGEGPTDSEEDDEITHRSILPTVGAEARAVNFTAMTATLRRQYQRNSGSSSSRGSSSTRADSLIRNTSPSTGEC